MTLEMDYFMDMIVIIITYHIVVYIMQKQKI